MIVTLTTAVLAHLLAVGLTNGPHPVNDSITAATSVLALIGYAGGATGGLWVLLRTLLARRGPRLDG